MFGCCKNKTKQHKHQKNNKQPQKLFVSFSGTSRPEPAKMFLEESIERPERPEPEMLVSTKKFFRKPLFKMEKLVGFLRSKKFWRKFDFFSFYDQIFKVNWTHFV